MCYIISIQEEKKVLQNIKNSCWNEKIKKVIHDNADKGRIKLSGTDTPAFSLHSPHFQSQTQV